MHVFAMTEASFYVTMDENMKAGTVAQYRKELIAFAQFRIKQAGGVLLASGRKVCKANCRAD